LTRLQGVEGRNKRRGGEIDETITNWLPLAAVTVIAGVGFAASPKKDMHAYGQRSEDLLLPTAEEREVVMQAGEEGSR
jgi:hypothetical protein